MSWPKGLHLYENALTQKQSKKLYNFIDGQDWDDPEVTKISREVQHYGFRYPYLHVRGKKCKTLPKAVRTTPEVLICMAKALYDLKVLSEYPNQIIINKYVAGEGIGKHTDHEDCFGKDVASLSLGSEVKMTFRPVKGKAEGDTIKLPLKVGSLLTFGDDARYKWTHAIEKSDTRNIVKPRISITFRHVKLEYQGSNPAKIDVSKTSDMSESKNETITITFGGQVENQVGMEKIGEMAEHGFSVARLKKACRKFEEEGYEAKVINLNKLLPRDARGESEEAAVLLVRNGIRELLGKRGADKLFKEQKELEWDTKSYMRGRMVEKHARSNVCYADFSQKSNLEKLYKRQKEGRELKDTPKGMVYDFEDLKYLKRVREKLPEYLGSKADGLLAEGNYYFNADECGIGFHGDAERKIVIALRLGATIPLYYQWYYETEPVGKELKLELNHGDFYVMSEKATGFDWNKKTIYTLRHAAGADKYTHAPLRAKLKKKEKKETKPRQLSADSKTWSFQVGKSGIIPDSVGYGTFHKPTKKLKKWEIEDPDILEYEFKNVTPEGWVGGSKYEHTFTALEPGKTTAIDGYTGNKVRVTVK
jgi:alkylated DNA repair dioxygenase AlkB